LPCGVWLLHHPSALAIALQTLARFKVPHGCRVCCNDGCLTTTLLLVNILYRCLSSMRVPLPFVDSTTVCKQPVVP